MTATPPYDSRSVANLLLDLADARGIRVTNLSLQKLLYFAHGQFLVARGTPLVDGYFEAWRYGPVHPTVYKSFKTAEGEPLHERAVGFDYRLRQTCPIAPLNDPDAREHVERVLLQLGRLPAGRLIEISHAPRGPWAETVNKSGTNAVLGLRISDKVTLERFRFLMVPLKPEAPSGEPLDDTPLA